MNKYFYFWEKVDGFDIRVLNEREARAWAWIIFVVALVSFLSSCLTWNFFAAKIVVILFLIDFFIRVIINPKFAPSLILGRLFVWNQTPEYVWAAQKRFAWALGLGLAIFMFFTLVINNIINPFTIIACILCLFLLFFETAFGICLGCKMYNLFYKKKAELCPGWVCEIKQKEEIQKVNMIQIIIIILFFIFIFFVLNLDFLKSKNPVKPNTDNQFVLPTQTWSIFWWIKNCMNNCNK